jgi:RNA exonuclease 1
VQYQFYDIRAVLPINHDIRVAVALDCEMGTAASGESELIRVTMVDYFSDEILVDNLVEPGVRMLHLNTR